MPPLTWRDTVAPDFSTTLGALRQSGNSINQGLGGLGDALGKFNEYSQGQNAAALMANAVKYNNPADLQAAFANGSIMDGVNPGFLTAGALKETQGQVGTLLNNAANTETNAFNLSADKFKLASAQNKQDIDKATQPALIDAPFLANKQTIANTGLAGANAGLATANAGLVRADTDARIQGTDQSKTLFGRGTVAYNDERAATPLINQFSTAQDQDRINQILASPEFQTLSPQSQAQVLAASRNAPAAGGGGLATRAISGALGPTGSGGQTTGSAKDVFAPKPGTGPEIDSINADLQAAKHRGTSASVAVANIVSGMSAGNQQQMAASPEAQIYTRGMVNEYDKNNKIVGQHLGALAPMDDHTSLGDIAEQMTQSGAYKGVPSPRLINTLKQTMEDGGGLTPAAAKVFMEAHPEGAGAWNRTMPYLLGGYNALPNDAAIHEAALASRKGTVHQTAVNSDISGGVQARLTAALSTYTDAEKEYAEARGDSNKKTQVDDYKQKADTASAALQKLLGSLSPNNQNADSFFRQDKDENNKIISRRPGEAPVVAPPHAAQPATAALAQAATPTVAPTIPGGNIPDPEVQSARGKVQAALDRAAAAKARNDPKAKDYQKTANKASQALQDAIESSTAKQAASANGPSMDDLLNRD
jgi:hypothetical protein